MQDAWRAYLELALGLTEASRKRAQTAVRRVVGQSGATAAQLQSLAEELLSTGMANREALTKLVRFEVDRALGAVGLATAEEVAELTTRVRQLERELREARGTGMAPAASATTPQTAAPSALRQTVAKKAVAKKAVAKKAVAKKAVARRAPEPAPGGEPGPAELPAAAGRAELPAAGRAEQPAPGTKRVSAKKLPPTPARKAAARKQQPPSVA